MLIGPEYKINGGGQIFIDNVSSQKEDEEVLALYEAHLAKKRERRNTIILLLIFSNLNEIIKLF